MDREAIFRALFALTTEITWPKDYDDPDGPQRQLVTRTRRVKLFSDVPMEQQAWLGQAEHNEVAAQVTNQPYKWTLNAQWIIYHPDAAVPEALPTVTNNLILSAVERAMAPKPYDPGFLDERNTLSGLVHHCFIEGEVFKDPGDIDGQAMLVVPITVLVP